MTFLAQFTLLLPYLVATGVSLVVGVILVRGRDQAPGRGSFGALMLSVSAWSFFNFMEDATNVLAAKVAYANLEFAFIGAVPVLFFGFAVRAALERRPAWLTSVGTTVGLWVVPVATAVAVWFDGSWGWVHTDVHLVSQGVFSTLEKGWALGFWFFAGYSYLLIAVSVFLWARFLVSKIGADGWAYLPFASVFLPWGGNVLMLLGANPWPGHDPTAPLFSLVGLVLLFSLEHNKILALLPEAVGNLLDTWPEPLVALDHRDRLAYFNPRAAETWGWEREDWGRPRAEVLPWLIRSGSVAGIAEPSGRSWEVSERLLGTERRPRGTFLSFHDVSAFEVRVAERTVALEDAYGRLTSELDHRRRTEQQLFYFSLHDSLTGLANRSLFLSRLGQCLEQAKRHPGRTFAVLLVNLKGFRHINEHFGHAQGDQVLVLLANRLRDTLRSVDTAARSGADTYLVLLDDPSALGEATQRIRRTLEAPLLIEGATILPELKMGVVHGDLSYESPEAVLDDAEVALDRAGAGDPVQVFRPEWGAELKDRVLMRDDLGKALISGGLHLIYQPIVDLRTGALAGVEVLTRWNHPVRGAIPPARFIAIAEREGTIRPLGLWVLRESSGFFARLQDRFPVTAPTFLAVNVSPWQLTEPDFPSIVLGILERERMDPRNLHLEITETALVENTEVVSPVLALLRREGIRIKLDDFGTGFSSLHSLHRLPVDTLKIDQTFVAELPQGRPIVRTILGLSAELGLDVVAEGIETSAQKFWLTELGCPHGQGFLFSRGWSGAEFEDRASRGSGALRFLDEAAVAP